MRYSVRKSAKDIPLTQFLAVFENTSQVIRKYLEGVKFADVPSKQEHTNKIKSNERFSHLFFGQEPLVEEPKVNDAIVKLAAALTIERLGLSPNAARAKKFQDHLVHVQDMSKDILTKVEAAMEELKHALTDAKVPEDKLSEIMGVMKGITKRMGGVVQDEGKTGNSR